MDAKSCVEKYLNHQKTSREKNTFATFQSFLKTRTESFGFITTNRGGDTNRKSKEMTTQQTFNAKIACVAVIGKQVSFAIVISQTINKQ
jgi:hypothetical protein